MDNASVPFISTIISYFCLLNRCIAFAVCNDSNQHIVLRETIHKNIKNVWYSEVGSKSLPMWGMFVNNFLNHGGEPLPDSAALTPNQYYVTTGTISVFSPFCNECGVSYTPTF